MKTNKIINSSGFDLVEATKDEISCQKCVFINKDTEACMLDTHESGLSRTDEIDLRVLCTHNVNMYWKESEVNNSPSDTSSTGVVNPSTDATPKEPSNDAPRVTKANTKRTLTFELTLKEAREYYYSHNPVLKHIACRLFTPAELEDVRRCTMNVDIKTAKRLYRNAEKAVRDFVLSAFSEEELKD